MRSNIERCLNPGEEIVWSGKPIRKAFILPGLASIPFGLIFLGFSLFLMWGAFTAEAPDFVALFVLPFVLAGVALMFGPTILQLMRYNNTQYVITDKRLITQTGAIGLDTRFVDFDKIQEVYVHIGLIDRLLGTGTLIAMTAGFSFFPTGKHGYGSMHGLRPSFSALKKPYEIQKLLQEAMGNAKQAKH